MKLLVSQRLDIGSRSIGPEIESLMPAEPDERRCSVCQFPMIPGISSCVNCGEPEIAISIAAPQVPTITPEEAEQLRNCHMRTRELLRRMNEARALEYATDVSGAIELYESLLNVRVPFTPPYRRLAIIYAKAKRFGDEERVIRQAISQFGGQGPGGWFVLRLAKILAAKRAGRRD